MKTKKHYITVACLLSLASICFAETRLNVGVPDIIEQGLTGSVKRTVETTNTKMLFSGSNRKYVKTDERIYNENGDRLIKELTKDGEVTKRSESRYDTNGLYLASTVKDFKKETTEEWDATILPYERKVIKRDAQSGDVQTVFYTPAGYEHSVEQVSSNGDLISFTEFEYLPNNKERKVIFYNSDRKPKNTFILEWNSDGTKSREEIHYHAKGMMFIGKYEYPKTDKKGNWTKRIKHTVLVKNGQERDWSEETTTREIAYY